MKKNRIALYLSAVLIGFSAVLPIAPQVVVAASSDASVIASITTAIEQKKPTFTLKMTKVQFSRVNALLASAAAKAEPYSRYTIDRIDTRATLTGSQASVRFTAVYLENKQQMEYVTAQAKAALKKIIKPGMSQEEKVKVIHDYIVKRFAYDESMTRYSAYQGLTKGTTVCQGYTLLGYRMLTLAGIDTRIVEGRAGGQSHAWNKVKVDGRWYNLDLTWDDPTPDRKNEVSYAYYLVNDELLSRDHTWTKKTVPAAVSDYRAQLAQKAKSSAKHRNMLAAIGGEITSTTASLQQKVIGAIEKQRESLTLIHDFGSFSPKTQLDRIMKACSNTVVKQVRYAYRTADNGTATLVFTFTY
ncbi:transglutaminase domain-containing protein [Saccharibacillus kuerlensis]|uniref:Transglutaminase-like domain-containing protein n=1 Tax=Saccharibacillus kuerlensis TaxID=459527 RepID=A0ABQ2KTQ2_9BACL|nr:transglutaminase domain-containing protein [Saccharibacillus kuerlensis]GGN90130.1 hypothetical protein GCM10010969_00250 [Saccharibacillus kuerlensis]